MDTRRLLSSTALYGIADIAVMAVGGFLLLPLYTRTLSQDEFGMFVAIRANIDILTYVLQFGMVSAVARVYFDYKANDRHHEYLSTVVSLFMVVLAAFVVAMAAWGPWLWAQLSPTTPVHPYLELSIAIAAAGFLAGITSLWLRLDGRVLPMVALQLTAAVVLAAVAAFNLLVLDARLKGILCALLASSVFGAALLPRLFEGRFRFGIHWKYVTDSLHYAIPILVGYIAYFVLNRFSTLMLQRHVLPGELAVYGVAQQLSMIVSIACTSFGMALQPAVFATNPAQVNDVLQRSGRILVILVLGTTVALILCAEQLLALVAPKSYGDGYHILLLLLVANFSNTFTMMSDTALLYHRRPKTSVSVSIFSAAVSGGLGLWLIPRYHLHGAALSVLGAFAARMLVSHWMAYRVTGQAAFGTIFAALGGIAAIASFAALVHAQATHTLVGFGAKSLVAATTLVACFFLFRKLRTPSCAT